ncbi:MAG: ankyrin repeat domain-containing protein, partial [Planctomycetes bacterium]|nr:ankyrin repeat domain-containing protein [Planctomycetota bacterium]
MFLMIMRMTVCCAALCLLTELSAAARKETSLSYQQAMREETAFVRDWFVEEYCERTGKMSYPDELQDDLLLFVDWLSYPLIDYRWDLPPVMDIADAQAYADEPLVKLIQFAAAGPFRHYLKSEEVAGILPKTFDHKGLNLILAITYSRDTLGNRSAKTPTDLARAIPRSLYAALNALLPVFSEIDKDDFSRRWLLLGIMISDVGNVPRNRAILRGWADKHREALGEMVYGLLEQRAKRKIMFKDWEEEAKEYAIYANKMLAIIEGEAGLISDILRCTMVRYSRYSDTSSIEVLKKFNKKYTGESLHALNYILWGPSDSLRDSLKSDSFEKTTNEMSSWQLVLIYNLRQRHLLRSESAKKLIQDTFKNLQSVRDQDQNPWRWDILEIECCLAYGDIDRAATLGSNLPVYDHRMRRGFFGQSAYGFGLPVKNSHDRSYNRNYAIMLNEVAVCGGPHGREIWTLKAKLYKDSLQDRASHQPLFDILKTTQHQATKQYLLRYLEFLLPTIIDKDKNRPLPGQPGWRPPGATALHQAVIDNDLVRMRVILETGADPDTEGRSKDSAMFDAAQYGQIECMALLLEYGANLTPRSKRGFSPIHEAAKGDHVEAFDWLLSHGADINAKSNDGMDVLMQAIISNASKMVVKLLPKHYDPTFKRWGKTYLVEAKRHSGILQLV